MRLAFPILLLASLQGCSLRSTRPVRSAPVPPPLPAALSAPCPPLRPVTDASIAALAQADMDAALAYADCAAKHAGAANAYEAAREEALKWNGGNKP
jgi:hypothetical protein